MFKSFTVLGIMQYIMFINQFLIVAGILMVGTYIKMLDDDIKTLSAMIETPRIELTVHSVDFDPNTFMMFQSRSATVYPLPMAWEAFIIDAHTEEQLCEGHGIGKVTKQDDNLVGPWTINYWVGDDVCLDKIRGRTIIGVAKWTWTDQNGSAKTTGSRTRAVAIPSDLVQVQQTAN